MPQANRQPDPRRRSSARLALALVFLALAPLAGCQTTGPVAVWRAWRDDTASKAPTQAELGDDRGLMARWLTPKAVPPTDPTKTTPLVHGPDGWKPPKIAPNPEADAEFQAAEALFQQGKLAEAESAFAKLAKAHKGDAWGEKGQFYLAETQYQRGRFVRAHDSFEKLLADYPNSIFLEKAINREYKIAMIWFDLYDPKTKPDALIPWYGRFNGSRPLLDTNGYARQVLDHVRIHAPDGPLADDAVKRIADECMKLGAYEDAAEYYDQLAKDHPKSPFLQEAQHAAIDALIKGYIGPDYDVAGLEKAQEKVRETMKAFPDRPEGNEKLYHTLDLINDQMAERAYRVGDYYRRVGKVASAEYYFGMLPQRWPKSPWTAKAKTQLATLATMPREKSLPSKIMGMPSTTDPFSRGMGAMGGMNGMGMGGMGMGGMGMGGMGMPGGMM